jgi:hypothetical protein
MKMLSSLCSKNVMSPGETLGSDVKYAIQETRLIVVYPRSHGRRIIGSARSSAGERVIKGARVLSSLISTNIRVS